MHWELYHVIDSCFERTDSHHLILPHVPSTRHWTTKKPIMTSPMVTILPHTPSTRHWTTKKPIMTSPMVTISPHMPSTRHWTTKKPIATSPIVTILPHVPSTRHWTTEKPIMTSQLSKSDPRVCCAYKYRGDESFLSLSFYIIIYNASRSSASTGSFNPSSALSGSPFTVYSVKPFTKMLVTSPLTSDPSSCE